MKKVKLPNIDLKTKTNIDEKTMEVFKLFEDALLPLFKQRPVFIYAQALDSLGVVQMCEMALIFEQLSSDLVLGIKARKVSVVTGKKFSLTIQFEDTVDEMQAKFFTLREKFKSFNNIELNLSPIHKSLYILYNSSPQPKRVAYER